MLARPFTASRWWATQKAVGKATTTKEEEEEEEVWDHL